MVVFHLGQLAKGPVEQEGALSAEELDFPGDEQLSVTAINYRLTAKLVGNDCLAEGEVSLSVEGECGRCLCRVVRNFTSTHVCIFKDDPPGETVDLTQEVREEALLLLPVNLLCSEDCLGLCPDCGGNRNKDECLCPAGHQKPTAAWAAELDKLELNQ